MIPGGHANAVFPQSPFEEIPWWMLWRRLRGYTHRRKEYLVDYTFGGDGWVYYRPRDFLTM